MDSSSFFQRFELIKCFTAPYNDRVPGCFNYWAIVLSHIGMTCGNGHVCHLRISQIMHSDASYTPKYLDFVDIFHLIVCFDCC